MKKLIIPIAMITLLVFTGISFAGDSYTGVQNTQEQAAEAKTVIGDIGSHNKGAEPKRYYAPAGEMNYPMAPNIFAQQPEDGYQTNMSVKDMIEFDEDGLTTQAQMHILNASKYTDRRIMVRPKIDPKLVTDEDRLPLDVPMGVIFEKIDGVKSIATITVLSDDKKSIPEDVFAEIQVEAWELGGEVLYIKAEGYQIVMRNGGAGIGITFTSTIISGGQATAATGVVGAGKVWGDASLHQHPFITVHVLKAK